MALSASIFCVPALYQAIRAIITENWTLAGVFGGLFAALAGVSLWMFFFFHAPSPPRT
jgi:hypothetical protein